MIIRKDTHRTVKENVCPHIGGEKRLAALGLVFSTACLQRCQRNERAMRIRREKCLGWFTFSVGAGGWPHGGDGSACRGPVLCRF